MHEEPINLDAPAERKPLSPAAKFGIRIFAIVLLALIALPIAAHFRSKNRTVHIVNGTAVEYDIELDGRRITVPAFGRVPLALAEGEYTLRTFEPTGDVREESIAIRSDGFLNRAIGKPEFVLNPDRAAILYLDHVAYTSGSNPPPGTNWPDPEMRTGQAAYVWRKVDYAFRETPDRVGSGSGSVKFVTHLDHMGEMAPDRAASMVEDYLGSEEAIAHLKHRFRYEPRNSRILAELSNRLDDDEAMIAMLEPLLDRRPPLVEVHRYYQWAVERADPDRDLAARYDSLVDAAPDDGRALYLRARLIDDGPEVERLMARAIELGEPTGNALHTLVIRRMAAGRFADAVETAEQLARVDPNDLHYRWHEAEALRAAGRIEEALPILLHMIDKEPWNTRHRIEHLDALLSLDRAEEARAAVDRFLAQLRRDLPSFALTGWNAFVEGMWLYLNGDEAGAAEALRQDTSEYSQLLVALADSDFANAVDLAGALDGPRRAGYLTITSVAAHHAGDVERGRAAALSAAERLARGDRYDRRHAAWLRGDATPSRDDLLDVPMHSTDRVALLTFIGLQHPELREWCFDQARTLNFDRMFPHLLIRSVVGE